MADSVICLPMHHALGDGDIKEFGLYNVNLMKNLLIIGARGFGREIYNLALESIGYGTEFTIKGFWMIKRRF